MKMIKKNIALATGLLLMGSTASFAQSLADAKKAIDAEQFQKATSMLKTLVANQPKEGDNYFNLGKVYLLTDEIDSARAAFTNGTTADPKNALNYVGLGQADLLQKNATNAKTNFDKAIGLKTKDYATYLAIGRAYIDQPNVDYAQALPNLQKADELDSKDKDPETFLALADFYAQQRKNTEAYPQYLRALDINPNLYRANVQIGKMYKDAFAFPEAEAEIKKVIAADPNYGPAYRELAEAQMQWSFADPKNGPAKKTEALENMRKYLDLTDKSFDSRLRYAQFLVYAGDFATLEKEVATLNAPDPKNPKTFVVTRMRGYSAVENKNFDQGIKYMNELFARTQDTARIIGSDYLYLGKAQLEKGQDSLATFNITKAVKLDSTKVDALADVAKKYYAAQNFPKAAEIYETVVRANSKSPDIATNAYYWGVSHYFNYATGIKNNTNPSKDILVKADTAFSMLTRLAPEFETGYLYRARVNKNVDDQTAPKGLAVPFYEKYIELVVSKPDKAAAAKGQLIEAYNYLGAFYAATDKEKAKDYFNKTLALDPQNALASDNIKFLAGPATPAKKTPIKK
ncbi:MAG: tetratricopeptide repeat protein [Flavobacteriales bacterium]|nr:MAG: tetratricopeptide repeat protein [Flavobacteriales bacterium]